MRTESWEATRKEPNVSTHAGDTYSGYSQFPSSIIIYIIMFT